MKTLAQFIRQFTRKIGVCGNAGVIVGSIAGVTLALWYLAEAQSLTLGSEEVIYVTLLLTLVGWLVLIFIFTAFVHAQFLTVVFPAMVNSFLVCTLTVYISYRFGIYRVGWLVGIVAGMVIGRLLCTLYKQIVGATNGLH